MESKKVMAGVIMYISSTMDSRSFGINHKSVCVTRTSGHFAFRGLKARLAAISSAFCAW